jgi:hypothetical protein
LIHSVRIIWKLERGLYLFSRRRNVFIIDKPMSAVSDPFEDFETSIDGCELVRGVRLYIDL